MQEGSTNLQNLRILVVDDEPEAREMMHMVLEFYGAQITEASNGEDALNQLQSQSFDLIITDLSMPKLDGREMTRRIKANPQLAHIPILVVSAHSMPEDVLDAQEAGCDAYITKPVKPPELLQSILTLLGDIS